MVLTLVVETVVFPVVVLLVETVVCEIFLVERVLMFELVELEFIFAAETLKTLKLTVNPNINSKVTKYFLIINSLRFDALKLLNSYSVQ